LTATDTGAASINGRATLTVQPAATHFIVTGPASGIAGSVFSITVTAADAGGSTVSSYTGTLHFTSSDGQAVLPADYTFTSGDAGAYTFSVTLSTGGSQTITATDTTAAALTGTGTVAVPADHLTVSAPSQSIRGGNFGVTVTAVDPAGFTDP